MSAISTPIPARDLFVATPDGTLFARIWGALDSNRAPIVLLHDSLGCVELWRDFPERLARTTGRAIIAYDRLGFGASDAYPGPLPQDFIAREAQTSLRALRETLGVGRMILFGHSVGGGMAVAAGAAYPEDTEAIVTVAAQAFVEDRTLAGIRAAQAAFEAPGQIERLQRYHGDKAQWVLDAWIKTWLSPEFADWTLDDALLRLRSPLLALHGDRDEYGSNRHPEILGGGSPGANRVSIIPDCGHVPHRERPEAVLAAVREFIAA